MHAKKRNEASHEPAGAPSPLSSPPLAGERAARGGCSIATFQLPLFNFQSARTSRRLFPAILLVGCVLCAATSFAAESIVQVLPIRSSSEQFVVSGRRALAPRPLPAGGTNLIQTSLIRVTPELLAVSCERIKQALLGALGIPDRWRQPLNPSAVAGRIHVIMQPMAGDSGPIKIVSTRDLDRWQYAIEIPEQVEAQKAVRAIVQVLLLEFANRTAGVKSAEVPLWLSEGLLQELEATTTVDLLVERKEPLARWSANSSPETARWLVSVQPGTYYQGRARDPFAAAHYRLANRAPLTFTELSLPTRQQFAGEAWGVYESSSHVLVHELLALPDGRENLIAMLRLLPQYWNWQTAFLQVFHTRFETLLDVEKWWAVSLANFTGRNQWHVWTQEIGLEKLREALQLPVEFTKDTNDLPERIEVPLQRAIADWDFTRQKPYLQRALAQLSLLRPRAPMDLIPLLDDYQQTVADYLQRRERAGYEPTRKGQRYTSIRSLVREVTKRLDDLDEKRAALERKGPEKPEAAPAPVRQ
jgi:hypothetical protein